MQVPPYFVIMVRIAAGIYRSVQTRNGLIVTVTTAALSCRMGANPFDAQYDIQD